MSNPYCEHLDIATPDLAALRGHPEANHFTLLVAALLEHGGPMTLPQVAERFAEVGIAPVDAALRALQRCRPDSRPIQRDQDSYHLDVHDQELEWLLLRLDLRPQPMRHLRLLPRLAANPVPGGEDTATERDADAPPDGAADNDAAIHAAMARERMRRAKVTAELATRRLAVVRAFPDEDPVAVAVLDARARELRTFFAADFVAMRAHLDGFDEFAGVHVRAVLRRLGIDPRMRQLADLAPAQKTKQLNRRRRTLKITTDLLVRGTCGISQPFGDESRMERYLADGETTKLRRRLEADAKSLFAFYNYGMLHGRVRLVWGFLDEELPAPWARRHEGTFFDLAQRAGEERRALQVVFGSAPGWEDPWSRAVLCRVRASSFGFGCEVIGPDGMAIDPRDVQLARLHPPD